MNILKHLLVLSLIIPITAGANDGFGITYDVKHDDISCVMVDNAHEFNTGNGVYLYFNYDSEVARKLGRTWTLVEPNKCYEYGGEYPSVEADLYLVITQDKNFIEHLADEQVQKSYGSLEPAYVQNPDGFAVAGYRIAGEDTYVSILEIDDLRGRGLGGGGVEINNLDRVDMNMFKYHFGEGITGGTSNNPTGRIESALHAGGYKELSARFANARELIVSSLKEFQKELASLYGSCLPHVKRYETRITLEVPSAGWSRYQDLNYTLVGKYLRTTDERLYSVRTDEELKSLFDQECNQRLYELEVKWRDDIDEKGLAYYELWQQVQAAISGVDDPGMFAFLVGPNEKVLPLQAPEPAAMTTEPEPVSETDEVISDSDDVPFDQNVKNIFDAVMTEKNYLFLLYILLPILALFGLYRMLRK